MRHILQWIFVFAAALASVFTLQSCGLEEPFHGLQNSISEGSVEFVVRPASYNNHDVTTKADGDFDDAAIHNAFIILFNAEGKRILFEEINIEDSQLSMRIDRSLGNVTACVLANVPASFAKGIIGTTNPGGASANQYLNTAVLDLTYNSSASDILGVPVLDLDDNTSTSAVPCIPMIGQTDGPINLTTANPVIQIDLTRLFAKVSVELTLNIPNLSTAQSSTHFELNSYRLVNLPLKVNLLHQNSESSWVTDGGSFAGENSHVRSNINHNIYNNSYILAGDSQKKYSFVVYVPEYQLAPLDPKSNANYGKQEFKPQMYDKNKKAVHIVLKGSYIPGSGTSTNLDYSVFLGEDASTSFTLNRNVQYNNTLTITGITKNADNKDQALVDHRVKMSDGDMVNMFGEVANCYVISKVGEYNFPAYKGAFKADEFSSSYRCHGNRAEIIYRTNQTDIIFEDEDGDGNPIKVTTDIDGTKVIEFKLSKIAAEDNVIIAMYDPNGNIEWSWHLWFVTGLQLMGNNTGYFQMSTQAMPDANGKEMIDRNLGVVTSRLESILPGTLSGTYYKYGRKEPYLGNKYQGGGESDKYDWSGDSKSRTDPCPPGYRVPASSVWNGNTGATHSTLLSSFLYWDGDSDIYYPYSNYLLSNERFNENMTEAIPFQNGYTFETSGTHGTAKLNLGILGKYDVRALARDKFTIIDMTITASKQEGRLWSNSGYFYYSHSALDLGEIFNSGVDGLREELQINEYKHERRVVKEYKVSASLSELRKILQMLNSGNITDAFLESIAVWGDPQPVNPPMMTENDINTLLGRLILLDNENIEQTNYQILTDGINTDEGYQVRCVKE